MSLRTRPDTTANRRMLTAAILFAVAMLMVGGSITWTIASKNGEGGEAGGNQSMAVCVSVLCVFAAVVNVFRPTSSATGLRLARAGLVINGRARYADPCCK